MKGHASKELKDFLNATKMLIMGGVFLTIGFFMIVTYFVTDIEYDEIGGSMDLLANKPTMFELKDLEKGDNVYITVSADDELDIIVDTVENGRKYIDTHSSFDPYLPPQSSYLAQKVTEKTVTVVVDDRFSEGDDDYYMGIIFQKTPYTTWQPTEIKFTISSPNHVTQNMCVPVGVIFILGAVGFGAAHVIITRRERRFAPLEPKSEGSGTRSSPSENGEGHKSGRGRPEKGTGAKPGTKASGRSRKMGKDGKAKDKEETRAGND